MEEEKIKQLLPNKLLALTPRTITLRSELLKQLEGVRKTGLAFDDEEYTTGIICIGSPVFDVQGKAVAGVGTTCLLSTVDEKRKEIFKKLVLECAYRISKSIGYTGDFFSGKIEKRD